jgi:hypothetical protein
MQPTAAGTFRICRDPALHFILSATEFRWLGERSGSMVQGNGHEYKSTILLYYFSKGNPSVNA